MTASFRSRLGWTWLLVVSGLLVSLYLAHLGLWGYRVGLFVEGSRWLVLGPLALALPIFLGAARLGWQGTSQQLVLGPHQLTYRHHGRQVSDRWERILVAATPRGVRLTNGVWTVRLDRAFYPDYRQILKLILERRGDARRTEEQVLAH